MLRTLTPTCAVKGARDAIALYERLFGAKLPRDRGRLHPDLPQPVGISTQQGPRFHKMVRGEPWQ